MNKKTHRNSYWGKRYIALEDSNLDWKEEEVKKFDQLWEKGVSLYELKHIFKRTEIEMVCLIMDRHKKGFIKSRDNGLYGGSGINLESSGLSK